MMLEVSSGLFGICEGRIRRWGLSLISPALQGTALSHVIWDRSSTKELKKTKPQGKRLYGKSLTFA